MRQMEALDHTDAPSWSWLRSSDVKAAQPEGEGTKSPGADAESAEKLLPAESGKIYIRRRETVPAEIEMTRSKYV